MTAKPRTGPGSRTGTNARSGPSGPTTPRAQRTRRPVEVTLGAEARALLDAESRRTEETRSALVEALILSHIASEAYLPPVLLERAQALATRTGQTLGLVLAEAMRQGLDRLAT